ncbi:hypothetical protein [Microvirga sp. 17 mud 1-3]|uniref:hypothetical protein n=1 Tax=Microvirga sp. 17 mud 1-3 TaxID=2082949 RepID=UPI000D6D7069|nr:hypothetical protein [Microvirga sp. 17 mud 1-3]AWM87626.1 hypothetical protein C4E04_13360 [Microvirga sp. 17 mud 1-3]
MLTLFPSKRTATCLNIREASAGARSQAKARLWSWAAPLLAFAMLGMSAPVGRAAEATLAPMPADLETRYALSALPPALREPASVFLLDPGKGYRLSRQGTSGVACLVERTAWELADFRNDIYVPICFDAEGARTYLKAIMDAAALRAEGMGPVALKTEIEHRFQNRTYAVPGKAGVSYMVAPVMRTVGPPEMKVHTMPMPHFMVYAPGVTNEDIGAAPDLGAPSSLLLPFIDRQGVAEHSYIILLVGEAERARILADEKVLMDDLCAYREVLCLEKSGH